MPRPTTVLGVVGATRLLASAGLPDGGRLIDLEIGGKQSRIAAAPFSDGRLHLRGHGLDVKVEGDHLSGYCPAGRLKLEVLRQGDHTTVSGTVGGEPVRLSTTCYGDEVSISGSVGNRNVFLTQHRQIDGHLITGYAGSQAMHLREREIPGQGPNLDPVTYLAALLPPADANQASRINYLV